MVFTYSNLCAILVLSVNVAFSEGTVCKLKYEPSIACIGKGDKFFQDNPGFEGFLSDDGPCFTAPDFGITDPSCFNDPLNPMRVKPCDCSIAACACPTGPATTTTTQATTTLAVSSIPSLGFADNSYKTSTEASCQAPAASVSDCSEFNIFCDNAGDDNSACPKKFCPKDVSSACGTVCFKGISEDDANAIVNRHNELRRKVAKGLETDSYLSTGPQPSASNMRELKWDPELATVAQSWANQCNYAHDDNHKRASNPNEYVGQNAAQGLSSAFSNGKTVVSLTDLWYSEVKCFDPSRVSPYNKTNAPSCAEGLQGSTATGHYTQVVWGETSRIGCGYIKYKPTGSAFYKELFICNYAVGGNIYGGNQDVYKIGTASNSTCPTGTYVSDGLCKEL